MLSVSMKYWMGRSGIVCVCVCVGGGGGGI